MRSLWTQGMDGSSTVIANMEIQFRTSVGDAIDATLAAVCDNSDDTSDAIDHLNYINSELTKVRNNMRQEQ